MKRFAPGIWLGLIYLKVRLIFMCIHLSRPDITEKEIQAVTDVLGSPNLSLGPKLTEFEDAFARYTGRKRAVAVSSGTSALFLCLSALGIGTGDEVITTPFTFIATVNSIMMVGAKPVFADIDPETLNIDPGQIAPAITEKTKAVMPIEAFGNPAGFDRISEEAKKHNLILIEDSCEALGSALNGKKAGTFGKVGLFAFYPNKQITTGEGGMIVTDDDEIADICISLRNQGRAKGGGWLNHERLGYNCRISDINCALGIAQLARIDEIKKKRKQVATWYQQELVDDDRIIVPRETAGCDFSWFVFVVRLTEKYTLKHRDEILVKMRSNNIQVGNYFVPVLIQPFISEAFDYKQSDFPVTDSVCRRTIALPFYNNLSREQVRTVAQELKKTLDEMG